jgi:hypothetical protein
VKRLLLGKLADESERRSNIINSQIVLALNFFKGHSNITGFTRLVEISVCEGC